MDITQMKYYKKLWGCSDEQLSHLTEIPQKTIEDIFSGKIKFPPQEMLRALESVLKPKSTDIIAESTGEYLEKQQGEYTLDDYYALPDERRVELIDGVIYDMTAPTTIHQIVAFQMTHQIENYIEEHGGDCMPYIAPVDVQLDCDNRTMVEPDVIILCDREKDVDRCIFGAPDFVAEVLSPATRKKDMRIKLGKYANAGVREYWMIDPEKRQVIVHWFDPSEGEEKPDSITIYGFEDKIPVLIFDSKLEIDFEKISKKLERKERTKS